MSARTFTISWRMLAASVGAGAALALAPAAAGVASADVLGSTVGSLPVVGGTVEGITSTVSGTTSSVPGASTLPGTSTLPDPSSLPVVGGVIGTVSGGTTGLPAPTSLPDPSSVPVVGSVIGTVSGGATGLPVPTGLPDPSSLPGVGGVLGSVSSNLPGGLPALPIVGSGPRTSANDPTGSDPSGFATFGAPIPFQAGGSVPATLPGGSLPFTGEPGWIHTAAAVAMGLAGLSALVAFALRLARRRLA